MKHQVGKNCVVDAMQEFSIYLENRIIWWFYSDISQWAIDKSFGTDLFLARVSQKVKTYLQDCWQIWVHSQIVYISQITPLSESLLVHLALVAALAQ